MKINNGVSSMDIDKKITAEEKKAEAAAKKAAEKAASDEAKKRFEDIKNAEAEAKKAEEEAEAARIATESEDARFQEKLDREAAEAEKKRAEEKLAQALVFPCHRYSEQGDTVILASKKEFIEFKDVLTRYLPPENVALKEPVSALEFRIRRIEAEHLNSFLG